MLATSGNSYFQTWLHYQQNVLLAIQKKIYTQTVIVGNKTEITNRFYQFLHLVVLTNNTPSTGVVTPPTTPSTINVH